MNSYRDDLLSDLRNGEYAAEYLTAARKESREAFLLALRDVAEARMGMKVIASEAGVNRENLYRMLSKQGNPRLSSLDAILEALGLGYCFTAPGQPVQHPPFTAQPSPHRRRLQGTRKVKWHGVRKRQRRQPAVPGKPPASVWGSATPAVGGTKLVWPFIRPGSWSVSAPFGYSVALGHVEGVGITSVSGGNNTTFASPWRGDVGKNALMRGPQYVN